MCLPGVFSGWYPCSLRSGTNHVAASWIRHKDTDFRVFHVPKIPLAQPAVGLVLDPSVVSIGCLYPSDAGTDGRENTGCGPGIPPAGNIPKAMKLYWRFRLTQYKNSKFGRNATWGEIDCQDMVKTAFLDDEIQIRLTSANSINVARWLPQMFYFFIWETLMLLLKFYLRK